MAEAPLISICIPAYKNISFLQRLLNSISEQTFTDYEVVVTDDSPDDTVKNFLLSYRRIENIRHFQNKPALGTPENWNEGIRKAKGKWIKLMHDDDWFVEPNALQEFYNSTISNPECVFFFSAFQNVKQETGEKQVIRCDWFDKFLLQWSPLHLFKKVYVGNPSCTLIRRDVEELYDSKFKFVVDFEYYIRLICRYNSYHYIDSVLLNIGFNDEQVTKYTFLVPSVQIPENILLLRKLGTDILQNIIVYDYYWRMFRNLKVRSVEEVQKFYNENIPIVIINMIRFQSTIPLKMLNVGVVSKTIMIISYLRNLFTSSR